jgi:hypothetical protein
MIADRRLPAEPTRSLSTASSSTCSAPATDAPRVHVLPECAGRQWAVSPASRAVYVLAGSPSEVGRRIREALATYHDLCSSRAGRRAGATR